jgi:hypothetical protein
MTKTSHFFRVFTLLAAMAAAMLLAVVVVSSYAPAQAQSAEDILKQPPFEPTDVDLFDPGVYSGASSPQPDPSGPTDEATLRQQLSDLLEQRYPTSTKNVKKALTIFDDADTKAIVPDPRLRAALVALKGTAGEPAIIGVLDGTYGRVYFGTPPCGCNPIAEVSPAPPGSDKPEIVFNQRYQYEDFRLLASTMAHEPMHRDLNISKKEELISNSIDTLVYGQFLLEYPELATSGTELARAKNTKLMARLNTRDANGKLRLFTSQGNIFPGGNFVPYFAAPFEPLGNDTTGNKVLYRELKKVVGKVSKKVNFDDKTLLLLDSRQVLFTDSEIVQLAQILKLDTSPPSATAQAQRRAQDEEAGASEQPVPDWREIFGEQ